MKVVNIKTRDRDRNLVKYKLRYARRYKPGVVVEGAFYAARCKGDELEQVKPSFLFYGSSTPYFHDVGHTHYAERHNGETADELLWALKSLLFSEPPTTGEDGFSFDPVAVILGQLGDRTPKRLAGNAEWLKCRKDEFWDDIKKKKDYELTTKQMDKVLNMDIDPFRSRPLKKKVGPCAGYLSALKKQQDKGASRGQAPQNQSGLAKVININSYARDRKLVKCKLKFARRYKPGAVIEVEFHGGRCRWEELSFVRRAYRHQTKPTFDDAHNGETPANLLHTLNWYLSFHLEPITDEFLADPVEKILGDIKERSDECLSVNVERLEWRQKEHERDVSKTWAFICKRRRQRRLTSK